MEITLNDITKKLEAVVTPHENAYQEAIWILSYVLDVSPLTLLSSKSLTLTITQKNELDQCLDARIKAHKPLQYIIGHVPFLDLDIRVRPPILIPRPETEGIVAWLITIIRRAKGLDASLRVLDMCTGSGCIALGIAHAFPQSHVVGVDINDQAINLAQENATHNNISNVTWQISDLFNCINANPPFDLIISNPPYISRKEFQQLDQSLKNWEDPRALLAEDDGLYFYKKIINNSRPFLTPPQQKIPSLVFEIGNQQAKSITALLSDAGYTGIITHKDLAGHDRWISAHASN